MRRRVTRRTLVRTIELSQQCQHFPNISRIKTDKLSVYVVSKRFIDSIRPNHALQRLSAPVHASRTLGTVLGEQNFSRRTFDRLVPIGSVYNARTKTDTDPRTVVQCLKVSTLLSSADCCWGYWNENRRTQFAQVSDLEIRTTDTRV